MIVENKTWKFLEEATQEELDLLLSVVSHCCSISRDDLNIENVVSDILNLRSMEHDASYCDFLKDIGKDAGCDPKIAWDIYPYMLLITLLREALTGCDSNKVTLISKEFDLSNRSISGIAMELRSRIVSNMDFRSSFPFILASILGINWKDSIQAFPIVSSITNITSLLNLKEKMMLAVVMGPLAKPISSFSNFLNNLFNTKVSTDKLFPVVTLLVLLSQEHNSGFEKEKDAIDYVNNFLRIQDTFDNTSDAAISLGVQLYKYDRCDDIPEIVRVVESQKLQNKSLIIPEYRIEKIIPYKDSVLKSLVEWIDGKDSFIDEFSRVTIGNHFPKKVIVSEMERETDSTAMVELPDKGPLDNSNEIIVALREKVSMLEKQLEEAKETFAFIRHDVKTMYATSVAPLYDFIDGVPLDIATVQKALEKESIVSSILNNAGKSDYGLRTGCKYSLKSMTEEAMHSDNYSFIWNTESSDMQIDIAESCFVNRVLANIRGNFERCAFGVSPYCEYPITQRVVEAKISSDSLWVYLTLSNNGCPISESDVEIIFRDGISIGARPSTGHGLAYVKKFMEYWGGEVVASVPKNNYNISFVFKFKK